MAPTLAAMKALWRELADPKIKEHHGPVVKTTRLAEIETVPDLDHLVHRLNQLAAVMFGVDGLAAAA